MGQYRLSASIPSVEINTLRATLGARPLPVPVTGAVRGVLHCTGPLEYPVFSGTAITIPPTKAQVRPAPCQSILGRSHSPHPRPRSPTPPMRGCRR